MLYTLSTFCFVSHHNNRLSAGTFIVPADELLHRKPMALPVEVSRKKALASSIERSELITATQRGKRSSLLTGYTGDGVRITAEGYGRSHDILKVAALQKSGDSLRHAALAGFVHPVSGTDFITGSAQIVSELIYRILPDLILAVSSSGKKDC